MKKNILKLTGVQELNRKQQLSVVGGNKSTGPCVLISSPFESCNMSIYVPQACSTSSFTGVTRCVDSKVYCCNISPN